MKAPKSLFDRPGRATAVVGAVVAVSATAAVALLSGTATATPSPEQPGRCTKNVNVRSEPDSTSRIVALCEEGTAVKVGEARDGFLRLTNLGGWAAQEYISVNGRAPAPAARTSGSEGHSEDSDDRHTGRAHESGPAGHHNRHGAGGSGASSAGDSTADDSSSDDDTSSSDPADSSDSGDSDDSDAPAQQAPRSGGIGGLLG
jgi:hypothetical protein